jgi:hypothetical protein
MRYWAFFFESWIAIGDEEIFYFERFFCFSIISTRLIAKSEINSDHTFRPKLTLIIPSRRRVIRVPKLKLRCWSAFNWSAKKKTAKVVAAWTLMPSKWIQSFFPLFGPSARWWVLPFWTGFLLLPSSSLQVAHTLVNHKKTTFTRSCVKKKVFFTSSEISLIVRKSSKRLWSAPMKISQNWWLSDRERRAQRVRIRKRT